jgi:ubiquitin conjugation factor E4 B
MNESKGNIQIRRRRLEKLSGPAQPTAEVAEGSKEGSQESSVTSPRNGDGEASTKPKITIKPAATTPASDNPFMKLTARPSAVTPIVRSTSAIGDLKRPRTELDEQSTPKPSVKKTVTQAAEDIDSYENRILGQIFRITLDPQQKTDASGHKLAYLSNLREELESENEPIRFSKDTLDQALLEACTDISHNKSIIDYLLPCWKRIMKALKNLRGYTNAKDAILKEAKRLCMSNCIFAVQVPELFG